MTGLRMVAAALGSLALAACAGDSTGLSPSTATGGGPSAFTGSVPSATGRGPAAPVTLDPRDRDAAGAAQLRALQFGEPGAPVSWRSPETGHHGTIVPGPAYQSNGVTCREFSHTVYADTRPQIGRGAACRNQDGTWTPSS